MADPRFAAFVAFAGLRLGEAAGVRVGDVDFLRRTLAVSRQVQRHGGSEIRAPKYGSERTVYLPDGLVQLVQRLRAGQRALGRVCEYPLNAV